jgi:hypothetical protein
MSMTEERIELVNPAVETEAAAPVVLAPGVDDLQGLSVALVDNGKWNAGKLLEAVRERLIERRAMAAGPLAHKQHYNRDLNDEERAELSGGADVALAAIGDCGSCTSYTVRDALVLEQLGVPAVALVTEPFKPLAESLAASLGAASARIVTIPHPLYGIDDDELASRADGVIDALEAVLSEHRA